MADPLRDAPAESANPYRPPSTKEFFAPLPETGRHLWHDREIQITTRASEGLLWIDSAITVRIDNAESIQQPLLHDPRGFTFRFRHEGKDVEARIQRHWRFLPHRLSYELSIAGDFVAREEILIQNWPRGVVVLLLINIAVIQLLIATVF